MSRPCRAKPPLRPRQLNCECRALVRLGLHRDRAAVLLDNPLTNRQAQAGAFADVLGGEKGVEYLSQHILRDADPLIFNYQPYPLSCLGKEHADIAAGFHLPDRVFGVQDHIRQHLFQLAGAGVNRVIVVLGLDHQADILLLQLIA